MKSHLFFMAATALVLTTSCSNSEQTPIGEANGESLVTLTVQAPEDVLTRAYGDGTTVDRLQYIVFDNNGQLVQNKVTKDAFGSGLTDNVNLKLVTGNTYRVVFWADKSGTSYYTVNNDGTVVVNYAGTANDETRDAFYACDTITVTGTMSETVTLRRPFAQINVGTAAADYQAAVDAKTTVAQTSFTLQAADVLNMFDGSATGAVNVNYTAAAIPTTPLVCTVGGVDRQYVHLAMNYVLVGEEREVVNVVTMGTDGKTSDRVFGTIPVQRNYRTNIVGNILCSDYDFNVVIDPAFNEPDNLVTYP